MKKASLFFILIYFSSIVLMAQNEALNNQTGSPVQSENFTFSALIQAGLRYSLQNDSFQGGRKFEVPTVRLIIKGMVESKFFYKVNFDLAREPNLLDAYIGYRHNEALRITAGAMKPRQSLDYIPDPGSTYFIDRARITGLLVQSREIGLSAEGAIKGFYYFAGIFNGNKTLSVNNNKFYGIARLQYTFESLTDGVLQLAVQGSYGNSDGTRSGNTGPILRGERAIFGSDLRWELNRLILAAEYMAGKLETTDILDTSERINGYYITAGYKVRDKTQLFIRWQSWAYKEEDFRDYQLSFALKHSFSNIISLRLGFDSYFPEDVDNQYGLSLHMQVKF